MEKGNKISKELLILDGWKFICSFAYCEVWQKEKDRILWNPISEEIVLTYEMKGLGDEKN